MNSIDTSGKIKFTMSVANQSTLEFLELSLHINEQNKTCVMFMLDLQRALCMCFLLHVLLKGT